MLKLAKKSELDINSSYSTSDGWVVSDGATANRAIIQTPGARGNLAGAPVASWVGWVDVPSVNPSFDAVVALLNSIHGGVQPNSLWVVFYAGTGHFSIDAFGASFPADKRNFTFAGFRAAYSGQRIWLEIRFTTGTANPVVRVNGVDISASFSAGITGTAQWLSSALVSTNHLTGYNWPTGLAPLGCWLNAHLTDAESETWRITGRPPAWVVLGGSMANQIIDLSRNSTFTAAATDWDRTANGSLVLDNVNQELDVTCTGTGRTRLSELAWGNGQSFGSNGRMVEVMFTVTNWAMSGPLDAFIDVNNTPGSAGLVTGNGTYVLRGFRVPQSITFGRFCLENVASTGSYSLKNVILRYSGALSLPLPQQTSTLADWTLLKSNPARLVGMSPVNPLCQKSDLVVGSQSFSAGVSIQVLGGAVIGSKKQRVVSISGNSSASTTISVGTTNGGTQIVNAQSVNGDFDIATFASRIIAANSSVWVTFAGNTTAQVLIKTVNL